MEETILSRLQQIITHIMGLSESARKINSKSVLNEDENKEAEVICQKLVNFINKFNSELNNYFRLSVNPSADDVSRFTTSQLQAEEIQIELSLKLKKQNPVINNTHKLSSKLPKLNLPTYDGNILRWQEFWDQYKSNIHDRDLPDVEKLLYLKSSLQGAAKSTIDGLESTNKNYEIAITTLQERYGKQSQIIDAHYSALSKIQPADTSNKDCRRVLNEVERHLRVLESLGENIGHNHLRFLILEKFPEELVYELKIKLTTDSIEEIRSELERTISAREEASHLVQDRNTVKPNNYTIETLHAANKNCSTSHTCNKPQRENGFGNFNKARNNFKNTRDCDDKRYDSFNKGHNDLNNRYRRMNSEISNKTFGSNWRLHETGNKRKLENRDVKREGIKRKRSCIFCGDSHYNDECNKFKTIKERKEKLNDLCYACLRKGHVFKDCRDIKTCVHCRGKHNRALCPKIFAQVNDN